MDFLVMDLEFLEVQGGKRNWWTGGNDLGLEGVWVWARSGEAVGEFVWYEGKPDSGLGADCLYLYCGGLYLGRDVSCSSSSSYPVCQIKT